MKIGFTGDTHGDLNFQQVHRARRMGITHLFICGDFGYVWDDSHKEQKRLNYLSKLGITLMFVDGNHENHDILDKLPVETMFGGKVHKIRDNIIHLMRGEVYEINGLKYFAFGGANSTDKEFRKEGKSWWAREKPSDEEILNADINLCKYDYKVDIILTHTCYHSMLAAVGGSYRMDDVSDYLNYIKVVVEFRHWLFGHMHQNAYIEGMKTGCLYKEIITLEELLA